MLKMLSIGLAACIASYLLGVVSDRRGIFPEPQLISLRNKILPIKVRREGSYILDAQDRLIGDAEKPVVACPQADGSHGRAADPRAIQRRELWRSTLRLKARRQDR